MLLAEFAWVASVVGSCEFCVALGVEALEAAAAGFDWLSEEAGAAVAEVSLEGVCVPD
jgi:hypothetical protein